MTEKIVGYLLIAAGIIVIVISSLNVLGLFTGKIKPVNLFSLSGVNINLSTLVAGIPDQKEILDQPTGNTNTEIIDSDVINSPLNLFAHIFLMGFFVTAGGRISSIGTKLVRPIKVSLKEAVPNVPKSQ